MKKLFLLACAACLTLALGLSAAALEVIAYWPDGSPWEWATFTAAYSGGTHMDGMTDSAGTATVADEIGGKRLTEIIYDRSGSRQMSILLSDPLPAVVTLRDEYVGGADDGFFMVQGRVLLPDGSPAAGSEIEANGGSATFPNGNRVGRDGVFWFKAYWSSGLTARLDGHADVSIWWADYDPNPELRFAPVARTLRGRVTDDSGAPLPGAQISAPGGAARSGADGRYTLDTWEHLSGRVTVGLSGYTFAPGSYELTLGSGDQTFDFVGTRDSGQPGPPDPPDPPSPPTVGESTHHSRSSRDGPYEDPNGFSKEEWSHWLKVAREIEAAEEGGTVSAAAGRYERLPFPVLRALRARRDVTLHLEWKGESVLLDHTLPAGRVFYPLRELMERYGGE